MKKYYRVALFTFALTAILQAANLLATKSSNFYLNENFFLGILNSNFTAIIFSTIILVVSIFLFSSYKPMPVLAAGIMSNIIDRIAYGGVVDYFKLPFWPIFNLADATICVGAIWLMILLIKKEPV